MVFWLLLEGYTRIRIRTYCCGFVYGRPKNVRLRIRTVENIFDARREGKVKFFSEFPIQQFTVVRSWLRVKIRDCHQNRSKIFLLLFSILKRYFIEKSKIIALCNTGSCKTNFYGYKILWKNKSRFLLIYLLSLKTDVNVLEDWCKCTYRK